MSFGAPTMQSTGQALMHSVQPMHQALVDDRQLARALDAVGWVQRHGGQAGDGGQAADALGAARRALVDAAPRLLAMASA